MEQCETKPDYEKALDAITLQLRNLVARFEAAAEYREQISGGDSRHLREWQNEMLRVYDGFEFLVYIAARALPFESELYQLVRRQMGFVLMYITEQMKQDPDFAARVDDVIEPEQKVH
jgi:hypothetical protein